MADNRPSVYWEGKTLVIRASALGRCIGELVRVGVGMTPADAPDAMKQRWAEGNAAEPKILAHLRSEAGGGYEIINDGDDQVALEMKVGPVVLRCHPDGIVLGGRGDDGFVQAGRVLEVKALRPSMFGTDIYDWQVSVEMAATRMGAMVVYAEKGEDGLLTGRYEIKKVDEGVYGSAEIKRRCLQIYKAVVAADIPGCDKKQFPCGFYREDDTSCGKKGVKDAAHEKVAEELPVPERLWRDYVISKRVAEDAVKDFKVQQDALKKILADRPGDRYRAGDLEMVKKAGRVTTDYRRMAADGVELAKYQKTGEGFWTITEKRTDGPAKET